MSRRRLLAVGWLIVLGLASSLPLAALFDGIVRFGGPTMVVSRPLSRPIIALFSDVDLRRGTNSIVVAVGGDVVLRGRVRDDVVALDGRAYLTPHTAVRADVLSIVGGIYRAPHVTATGRLGGALHQWNGKSSAHPRRLFGLVGTSIRLGLAAGLALLLAGTCLTIVFPWQVVLISTTLKGAPLKSVAAGVMILLTFTFLVVPLGLSLAGLPFALLISGGAALAWLFGMTAFAVTVGRLVARGPTSLLWASAAGLVILAALMAFPFVGPLLVTLTGLIGAGALAVALINRARPAAPVV